MFVRNAAASLTLAVFIFPISHDLGWSRTLIAGAASFGGLVAAVISPVIGWASDKYGVRLILTVSILVLGLSTFSLAWAIVPIGFYLAFGMGRVLFSSSIQIGSSVVVSRWFVTRRGRATGVLFLSHSMGMVRHSAYIADQTAAPVECQSTDFLIPNVRPDSASPVGCRHTAAGVRRWH